MQISKLTDNLYSQTIKLIRTTDSRLNWSDKQIFESFGDNHLVFGYIENGRLVAIAIFSYVLDTSELLYICVDKSIQSKEERMAGWLDANIKRSKEIESKIEQKR